MRGTGEGDTATNGRPVADVAMASLGREGFVVVRGAAGGVLEDLRAVAGTRHGNPEAFLTTARDTDPAERLRLDRALKSLLGPVLASALGPALGPLRIFMGAYLVKPPTPEWLGFHQDLTYTDERRHRSYTAWVPLVDVDAANGALAVVPGSHRWSGGMRAAGPAGSLDLAPFHERFLPLSRTLAMAAGDLLVWDAALVHGSHPNGVASDRPAVAAAVGAAEAEVRYFHQDPGAAARGFVIDDDLLGQARPFSSVPTGYPEADAWAPLVRIEEIEAALGLAEACIGRSDGAPGEEP